MSIRNFIVVVVSASLFMWFSAILISQPSSEIRPQARSELKRLDEGEGVPPPLDEPVTPEQEQLAREALTADPWDLWVHGPKKKEITKGIPYWMKPTAQQTQEEREAMWEREDILPNQVKPKPTRLALWKGMDYQQVKRIWLSKGYTIRDAREYNNYDETGEVTLIFPGPVVFNFRWWELQDWSGTFK